MLFADRIDAGQRLAELLGGYRSESPVVVALPRGGVPVGYEVARALGAPLDVCVVRKIGHRDQPELGLGAVAEGGVVHVDRQLMRMVGATEAEVAATAERESRVIDERVRKFRRGRAPLDLHDRAVILVDDGIATGGTTRAAVRALRERGASRVILAVPVAASQSLEALTPLVDEVVCIESTPYLGAIGFFYDDFTQVSDYEVTELLSQADAWSEGPRAEPSGLDPHPGP